MACEEYEALKQRLFQEMTEQDRAHGVSRITSVRAHEKRLADTDSAVKLTELASKWHVERCERCKREGNKPLEAGPL
jgi:hypothetical protein